MNIKSWRLSATHTSYSERCASLGQIIIADDEIF